MWVQAPVNPRLSFWQITLRAIPIVAALVSTALLAYFVLIGQRSPPVAQFQQQPMAQDGLQQGQFQPPPQQQMAPNGQQAGQFQQQPQPMVRQPQQQMAESGQGPQIEQQAQDELIAPDPHPAMPNDDKIFLLIQSTLIALNQANTSGNYSVLRDMAAPGFREANSTVKLAEIFANFRVRKLDLTPILLFQPKLLRRPLMSDTGMLRITGFVPTAPERVNFDLIFQSLQGRWRLYGVAVNTSPVQPQPVEDAPPAPAPKSEAPEKPAPQAAKPAAPAKKAAGGEAVSTGEKPAAAQVDIRDRLDNPPPPPPPAKPKPKTIFNPFGN